MPFTYHIKKENNVAPRNPKARKLGLGDLIESTLSAVGITPERVTKLIGKDCGCKQRKEWLNRVTLWAKQTKKIENKEDAIKYFEDMEREKEEGK